MATLGHDRPAGPFDDPTSGIAYALGMEGDAPTAAETTPDPAADAGTSSQGTDGADGQTWWRRGQKDSSNVATPRRRAASAAEGQKAAAPSGDAQVTMLRRPRPPFR